MAEEGFLTREEVRRFCEAVTRKVTENPGLVRRNPQDRYLFVELSPDEGTTHKMVLRVMPAAFYSEVSIHTRGQCIWRATGEWRDDKDLERAFQELAVVMARACLGEKGRFKRTATESATKVMRQWIAEGGEPAPFPHSCTVARLTTTVREFLAVAAMDVQTNSDAVRAQFFEVLWEVQENGENYEVDDWQHVVPLSASDWGLSEVLPGNVEAVCHEMSGYLLLAIAAILAADAHDLEEIRGYLSGKITSHP